MLADILGVEPQYLQFGGKISTRIEPLAAWPSIAAQDRAMIDALLALPPVRRKLVSELIRALTTPDK